MSSMSSIINITPEQAAALLPLLQSIASQSQTRENRTGNGSQDSSSNSSFVHDSSSEEHCEDYLGDQSEEEAYELKELVTKKKRNSKSTRAQNFLHCTIREAAKICGFWEDAPHLQQISSSRLDKFYKTVFNACPTLRLKRKFIRKRLSETLMNRRAYLQSTKRMPNQIKNPESAVKQKQEKPSNNDGAKQQDVLSTSSSYPSTNVQISSNNDGAKQQDLLSTSSIYSSTSVQISSKNECLLGLAVDILFDNQVIGSGMILSLDDNGMFASVAFKSKRKNIPNNIDLYEASDSKYYFNDLETSDDFKWKLSNLLAQATKIPVAELMDCSDDQIIEDNVSEYEQRRLNNINCNKRVLKAIMNKDKSKEKTVDSESKQIKKSLTKRTARTASKYWKYIDSDDDEWKKGDCNINEHKGKRSRKPSYKASH